MRTFFCFGRWQHQRSSLLKTQTDIIHVRLCLWYDMRYCQSDDMGIHYRHNPEWECLLIRKLPRIENVLSKMTWGTVRLEIPVGLKLEGYQNFRCFAERHDDFKTLQFLYELNGLIKLPSWYPALIDWAVKYWLVFSCVFSTSVTSLAFLGWVFRVREPRRSFCQEIGTWTAELRAWYSCPYWVSFSCLSYWVLLAQ